MVKPYDYIKRLLDVAGSALLLALLWPALMVLALMVRIQMGSPVLFRQQRPGKDGRIFVLYKFRTMTVREGDDAARLTPLGRTLRATSLDELPELYNILRGDMSFVGPRPLLPEYLPLYSEEQARRHEVRPGLTGLAQVSGRNALSWPERFKFDVEYVDNRSLALDARILVCTVRAVIGRDGISSDTSATMEPFRGEG
ncbi:MAG: sugar transferase [Coriobacteriia bacterium]|nr:sugar transferase [Coriobacteriia bacterium]